MRIQTGSCNMCLPTRAASIFGFIKCNCGKVYNKGFTCPELDEVKRQ